MTSLIQLFDKPCNTEERVRLAQFKEHEMKSFDDIQVEFIMASEYGDDLVRNEEALRELDAMRQSKPVGKNLGEGGHSVSSYLERRLNVVPLEDFLAMDFPPREHILSPWLSTQAICMVHAKRGVGKTHFALGVAVAVASGGKFLHWEAPKARGVLFIDGEMPAVVMRGRLERIIKSAEKKPTAPLKVITPDLQKNTMPNLATPEGQALVEPHLEGISLVIVDNISTLCVGGKENEAESWEMIQAWALRLRSRGISVLFMHHSGKNGLQRGTSKREDVMDTVICLQHGSDYNPEQGACFKVIFEKARGIYGDDTKTVQATLITHHDGSQRWDVQGQKESMTETVASLLKEGIQQKEIAEKLGVNKGTVSKHKKRALQQGLLSP